MALYFESTKSGKRFKVLEWDDETGVVKLQGEFDPFTEIFDKKRFKSMNYKLVELPDEDDTVQEDDEE